MAGETLTKAQRVEARKFFEELAAKAPTYRGKPNLSEAARDAGLKQQTFARALEGNFGIDVVRQVATNLGRAIAGVQPESIATVEATSLSEAEDRYPSRPGALELARRLGMDPDAIAAAAKLGAKNDADPGAEAWLVQVEELDALIKKRRPTTTMTDEGLPKAPEPRRATRRTP